MKRRVLLAPLVLLAVLAFIDVSGNAYWIRLATTFAMYAALALSWNVIGGFAGYPSFATAAFFGLGAYAGGILQIHGMPLPFAVLAAGAITAAFASVLGALVLHLRGHYFAIATLMAGEVVRELANNADSVTGGGMGLNLPLAAGDITSQARFYLGAMSLCWFGAALVCVLVARTRLGVGLGCIAQNEAAAVTIGIDARACKNWAFALSSLFAGCVGAVYASWVTYIDPTDVFDVLLAVKPIVMVLIGGASVWLGPVVGALVFLTFEELLWRNLLHFHAGLLGLLIAALVVFLPGGLTSLPFRRVPGRSR